MNDNLLPTPYAARVAAGHEAKRAACATRQDRGRTGCGRGDRGVLGGADTGGRVPAQRRRAANRLAARLRQHAKQRGASAAASEL